MADFLSALVECLIGVFGHVSPSDSGPGNLKGAGRSRRRNTTGAANLKWWEIPAATGFALLYAALLYNSFELPAWLSLGGPFVLVCLYTGCKYREWRAHDPDTVRLQWWEIPAAMAFVLGYAAVMDNRYDLPLWLSLGASITAACVYFVCKYMDRGEDAAHDASFKWWEIPLVMAVAVVWVPLLHFGAQLPVWLSLAVPFALASLYCGYRYIRQDRH